MLPLVSVCMRACLCGGMSCEKQEEKHFVLGDHCDQRVDVAIITQYEFVCLCCWLLITFAGSE